VSIHPTALVGSTPFAFRESDGSPTTVSPWVAIIDPDVEILAYTVIEAGTTRYTRVGAGSRISSHVYIGHDTQVGNRVWIAAGARIAGVCDIGDGAYIGLGAMIRQYVKIGAGALVGAGAVVVKDVPPGHVVVGNPAKFLRLR
jgi:acyl-[acyl carrier protein]--UDP-N-acetylglucosamine O-acyltransferase